MGDMRYGGKAQGDRLNGEKIVSAWPPLFEYATAASTEQSDIDLWHQPFGHLNEQPLPEMARYSIVVSAKIPQKMKLNFCQGCGELKAKCTICYSSQLGKFDQLEG